MSRAQQERIELLDELLSGRRKWTKEELLTRLEDHDMRITDRTLFRYFNILKEKGAPLHTPEDGGSHYFYEHKFSLKELPLDEEEIACLKRAVDILKEVGKFALLEDVDAVIKKLENRIHSNVPESRTIVQFENHTRSSGHEYFNELFDAIQSESPLRLMYQKFDRAQPVEHILHPYLLKEYRNRWFLVARRGNSKQITTFGLDRIKSIRNTDAEFIPNDLFDPVTYYEHVVGVSVYPGDVAQQIEIKAYPSCVPYIVTKPMHKNQEIVKEYKDGSVLLRVKLIVNIELKAILLAYGDGIEVKRPEGLRQEIAKMIRQMENRYSLKGRSKHG